MIEYKLKLMDLTQFFIIMCVIFYTLFSDDPFLILFGVIIGSMYIVYLSTFFGMQLYRQYRLKNK